MVTSFLPSEQRQQDNARAIKRLLAHKKEISDALKSDRITGKKHS